MKQSILIFFLAALTFGNNSCTQAEASKATPSDLSISDPYLATLKEAGFVNTPTVTAKRNEMLRAGWLAKGFHFIGSGEMDELLRSNGLLIAPADKFIGSIPDTAVKTLAENITRAKVNGIINFDWIAPDNRHWTNEDISKMSAEDAAFVKRGAKSGVFIAGPPSLFNQEGMIIVNGVELKTANNDPIVVAKVDDGYIELARW